jgi:hypothetical protein
MSWKTGVDITKTDGINNVCTRCFWCCTVTMMPGDTDLKIVRNEQREKKAKIQRNHGTTSQLSRRRKDVNAALSTRDPE